MKVKDFEKLLFERHGDKYGMCPPPIKAQEALDIITEHLLGDDWFVSMPISPEQVNTEIIYEILSKYKPLS